MARFVFLLVLLAVAYAAAEDQPACGENEKWSLCGTMCEPTCQIPNPNPILCPRIQCTQLTASCRCNEGYVRSKSHECVLVKEC